MCGITGWIDTNGGVSPEAVRAAMERMRHRGPNDEGCFVDPSGTAALGHRRLSIIDIEGGRQPLTSKDGRYHLVFNGEVYNFRDLRRALETRGHTFATQTDTEVVLHLFEDHGIAACLFLVGMFAFALWDARERTLWFARDRLGKKPFLYGPREGRFFFASEFAALLEYAGVPRDVDPDALDAYLAYQYIPPPLSIWKAVRKLPPATWGFFREGEMRTSRYWTPECGLEPAPRRAAGEAEVFRRLADAVRQRLVSDVPLGVFLSGGADSSIVTGLMSLAGTKPLRTFSIGFEEEAFSELPHARRVAEHFGTEHHEETVRPDAAEVLPALVRHYGEPFADSSAIPTWYLSRFTGAHVRVALA
ncbi:MAG: asparagine synthase (glutamine-hydrolyzing), partial [Candidatus Eisenbacteria bacterium]